MKERRKKCLRNISIRNAGTKRSNWRMYTGWTRMLYIRKNGLLLSMICASTMLAVIAKAWGSPHLRLLKLCRPYRIESGWSRSACCASRRRTRRKSCCFLKSSPKPIDLVILAILVPMMKKRSGGCERA